MFSKVSGELAGLVAAKQRQAAEADALRAAQAAKAALAAQATQAAQAQPKSAAPVASVAPATTLAASPAGSPLSMDEAFACIRQLESGNNYAAPNGGAYQFLDSTWHSLGYSGSAQDYPPAVQDQAARDLQARSGWSQWTVAPRCGLI